MARRATEKAHTKPELMCHESRSRMSIAAEPRTIQGMSAAEAHQSRIRVFFGRRMCLRGKPAGRKMYVQEKICWQEGVHPEKSTRRQPPVPRGCQKRTVFVRSGTASDIREMSGTGVLPSGAGICGSSPCWALYHKNEHLSTANIGGFLF